MIVSRGAVVLYCGDPNVPVLYIPAIRVVTRDEIPHIAQGPPEKEIKRLI